MARGISSANIKEGIGFKPYAIDVNSGVETDGIKDTLKIEALFEKLRDKKDEVGV